MNYSPLLSIIIISHNQRTELSRCVESVLAQRIPFDYEIILSDDNSSDGSYELAMGYQEQYPFIFAFQCNSDDCSPINRAQRAAWNRCNGYMHTRGKYLSHVDGDDFFRPEAHFFEKLVSLLESNPNCSLAISNVWCVEKGKELSEGHPWFSAARLKKGEIISAKKFISDDYFILNQAFVMRRNPDVNPVELYGKHYDDSIITYHHLQFGNIVCSDCCDYVYVQYPESISASVSNFLDGYVLSCLGIIIPLYFPIWRDVYYKAKAVHIYKVIKMALHRFRLQEENYRTVRELNVFLFSSFNRKLSIIDFSRLVFARFLLFLMIRMKWWNVFFMNLFEKTIV